MKNLMRIEGRVIKKLLWLGCFSLAFALVVVVISMNGDKDRTKEVNVSDSSILFAEQISCRDKVGLKQANILVEWCLATTGASHPPCNSANSCELMASSIVYGCRYYKNKGIDPPYFCLITEPYN